MTPIIGKVWKNYYTEYNLPAKENLVISTTHYNNFSDSTFVFSYLLYLPEGTQQCTLMKIQDISHLPIFISITLSIGVSLNNIEVQVFFLWHVLIFFCWYTYKQAAENTLFEINTTICGPYLWKLFAKNSLIFLIVTRRVINNILYK